MLPSRRRARSGRPRGNRMIGLYVACLLFGGILIGVSLALGGHGDGDGDHDHDHDHDADHDHDVAHDHDVDHDITHDHDVDHDLDHDHDHDHAPGTMEVDGQNAALQVQGAGPDVDLSAKRFFTLFLSMRFWTFATMAFGLTGVLLWLLGYSDVVSALVSAPNGALIGLAAALWFRRINKDTVTAEVGLAHLAGAEAQALLPIRPGDLGKIVVRTAAGRIELPARTRDDRAIDAGETVLVAAVADGVADVTRLPTGRRPGRQGVTS